MAEGGPSLTDLESQKCRISNLMKSPLRKGESWYLIDNRWFKQWKRYVGFDSWDTCNIGDQTTFPGAIDNSPLLKEDKELKEHLIDELDYVLVPQEAWVDLKSWYNIVEGQEPLERKVVEFGMFVKHCKVEVYLMELKLCENSNMDTIKTHKFSKSDTVGKIEEQMRKYFNITEDKPTRMWNCYSTNAYEHLGNKDVTAQDAGLYQGQILVIELQNEDGSWPKQLKSSTSSLSYGNSSSTSSSKSSNSNVISTRYGSLGRYSSNSDYDSNGSSVSPGLCGLSSLGNTCFMNSALQCMSNTPLVTEYFLADKFWDEVNIDNPLGMKGEIAKSFGELIKNLWSGRCSYVTPRHFKMTLGRFAPQFSGYQQHDTQELMAFLIDGLHEDLNRIKKKPYIEMKDHDNRPDVDVAKEAWANYRLRNDSIIVDIFHGLLKSTLVCPECSKISVTFDPFCYLSLPLPIKKERQIEVFYVALNPTSKVIQYKLTVPKLGTISDLSLALSNYVDVTSDKLIVTDVYNHQVHRVFQPQESVSLIRDRDKIYIYEVPVSYVDHPEIIIVPVYLREKRSKPRYNNYSSNYQMFGQPFLVPVPRKNCTYDTLYWLILKQMSRYVVEPDENNEWWVDENSEKVNGDMELSNGGDSVDDGSNSDENDSIEDDDSPKVSADGHHRLFTLHMVNSYGSIEVDDLQDNGQPIKFGNQSYIAIDWHPKAKETFYDWKLAEDYDQHESLNSKVQKRQTIQLSECLDLFTMTEKLGADDLWYCPACKVHQQATKKFDLWSVPNVLVIHLKRFSYNRYWRDKLDTLVEFPIKGLNMAKFHINENHGPAIYDLIAVSNHYGGMGGGHYTAYGKNKDDRQWYYYDDSSVSSATEESIVSKAAYVLFYQRRDQNTADKLYITNNNPVTNSINSKVSAAAGSANQVLSDDEMEFN